MPGALSLHFVSTRNHSSDVIYPPYARTARRRAGAPLVPTDWISMQCPETLTVEKRKVARLGLGAGDAGGVTETATGK